MMVGAPKKMKTEKKQLFFELKKCQDMSLSTIYNTFSESIGFHMEKLQCTSSTYTVLAHDTLRKG